MTDIDIAELGASKVDADTNLPIIQATKRVTNSDEIVEPLGQVAVYGSLGVTSLPAAADSNGGHCEALVARDCGGHDVCVLGCRDERTATVVAQLGPGETCLHSTGAGFDSRVFLKDQSASMIVGNDSGVFIDRAAETITLAIGGAALQIGANGVMIADKDGNSIAIQNGICTINATSVILGAVGLTTPPAPVTCNSPIAGGSPTPSASIFVPDPNAP